MMNDVSSFKGIRHKEAFRIVLPAFFSFLLFVLFITFGIFPSFKNSIMGAKRHTIKEMVELVCNGLSVYERQVREGGVSLEEAQRKARERIRSLRYGPEMKDYFWINDIHGKMIMHPYRKDLEGKNVIDLQDENGKYLIREFLKVVKEKGQGYVDYMWQWKDDPNRIVPKVSFVKGFKPWGWIVGTGIYIEDAKAEIGAMSRKLLYISLGILGLVGLLMLYVIREGIKVERSREEAETSLKESEARFRKLVEDAPFGVSIMKDDGTFEYVNPQFVKLFGYTLEDVPNKGTWFEKAYPDSQLREQVISTWEKDTAELKETGVMKERVFPVRCKNGEEKIVHFINTAFGHSRKLMTYEDITARAKAEEKLRESEKRYRALYDEANRAQELYRSLLQSSADAIVLYDLEGRAEFVSPTFTEMFGWTLDDVKGKRIPFLPDSEKEATMAVIKALVEKGTPCHGFETKRLTKDGHLLDVSISASRYTDPNGNPVGMLVVIRDISERKKLQAQLQQAQKMEAIGTLAGGIAHDFNNLLMGIQGNVSLMLLETDEEHPYYHRLKNIEEQIQSGSKLTSQLLGYARHGRYEVEALDVNEIVRETSETFGRTKKQITIHHDLSPDLWLVDADKTQIEQVLFNIYVNAWQAMPGGGDLFISTRNTTHKELEGRVYRGKPGNYVLLSIRDTGIGMDEKTQERIFDPFFTTKEMGHGTGLGLASAYGIIKGHGGYIDVESKKGHGATFKIYLPASKKQARPQKKANEMIKKTQATVLLVDDEKHIAEVGKELLEALGYNTYVASNGSEAVEIFREHKDHIDVVLLDMVMPKMSGKEVFKRLKEMDPNVKVLLSSGYSLDGEAQELMDLGCAGFIQKPFRLKDLTRALVEILA
ncbi:MAG: hypothetical protein DRG63_04230 [Deltaproteobacteria bacterium]|nr:MAG: hypothetical protein DRG63_04230 [Deltaproteobacteria bacterium]